MRLRKITIGKQTESGLPHYLYDMSLPLPERKLKRMYFPTGFAAATFLCVPPQRIYISRKNKAKIWSDALGGWFCVRIANLENETI